MRFRAYLLENLFSSLLSHEKVNYVQVYDTAFSHDVMAALLVFPNNENYFLFEKLVSFLMQTFLLAMAYQIIWAL